jgi:hypothetical protein
MWQKTSLWRSICRWEDNIKMDLTETGYDCVDRTILAQDTNQWRVFVNMVMNLRILYKAWNFLATWQTEPTNSIALELEGSSPHSQQPSTGPYPEPTESAPPTPANLLNIHLIHYSQLLLGLPSGLFASGFPTKTLYNFFPLPCVPHAPPTSFSLTWSA